MTSLVQFDAEKWPVVASLRAHGQVMMPGLSFWLSRISPKLRKEAWQALCDPRIQAMLHQHPDQVRQFFLADDGLVSDRAQLSVGFVRKAEKDHLTLTENGRWVLGYELLPAPLRAFLADCFEFVEAVRIHVDDILPAPLAGKICLKARLFNYASSDPLVGFKAAASVPPAMRPHVDGSVFTVVVAESDGCLRVHGQNETHAVRARADRAFGVLMPGIAAWGDYRLNPTPHSVVPSAEGRVSLTVFVTPDLGCGTRKLAVKKLAAWELCGAANAAA